MLGPAHDFDPVVHPGAARGVALVVAPGGAPSLSWRRRRGFSLVELSTVVLIGAMLLGFLFPMLSRARRAARAAQCLSNLRQIAVGFHVYAGDNGGRLPDPDAADESWETVMRNYLRTPDVFRCPADEEVFPAVGCSYDWRDTGDPLTTLAGQPLSDAKARNCVLVFDSLPHWHAKGKMNVALTDTSACSMEVSSGLGDLMEPVTRDKKEKKNNKGNKGNKGKGKGNGDN